MKQRIKIALVLLVLGMFVTGFFFSTRKTVVANNNNVDMTPLEMSQDPGLALTDPDKFNWALLAVIAGKAPANLQTTVNGVSTNNALWETWADDPFTFPGSPDPANPPQWANRNTQAKQLRQPTQLRLRDIRVAKRKTSKIMIAPSGASEEVRRNESSFDFIISNNLWYTEGLKCAYSKGVDSSGYPNGQNVTFKTDAIEVKARWKTIKESDKPNYHWNYDGTGTLYGLIGLHVISKTLPNWTWATFEWVGNSGRCDYMGCHDTFGVTPANVSPAPNPGGQYPPGTVTAGLQKLFTEAGFDQEWSAEWQNYRLKGSQNDFTSTTGVTNLLGNSIIEDGFVQTSSCMTCHANAAVDINGSPNPTFGFTPGGQSLNGPVNPAWFYNLNTWNPTRLAYKINYYPIDFIWAVANAQKAAPKPIPPCS